MRNYILKRYLYTNEYMNKIVEILNRGLFSPLLIMLHYLQYSLMTNNENAQILTLLTFIDD